VNGKKFDQLAIVVDDYNLARALTRIGDWVQDTVRTEGWALQRNGQMEWVQNEANLMFNYDMWPMEYEVLHYVEGWNWHMLRDARTPYLSHYGIHIEGDDEVVLASRRWRVLQESFTYSHTNPAIKDSRRYRYIIFDSRDDLGAELKLIQRLTIEQSVELLQFHSEKFRVR